MTFMLQYNGFASTTINFDVDYTNNTVILNVVFLLYCSYCVTMCYFITCKTIIWISIYLHSSYYQSLTYHVVMHLVSYYSNLSYWVLCEQLNRSNITEMSMFHSNTYMQHVFTVSLYCTQIDNAVINSVILLYIQDHYVLLTWFIKVKAFTYIYVLHRWCCTCCAIWCTKSNQRTLVNHNNNNSYYYYYYWCIYLLLSCSVHL